MRHRVKEVYDCHILHLAICIAQELQHVIRLAMVSSPAVGHLAHGRSLTSRTIPRRNCERPRFVVGKRER
jgi:hypothetical protein